MSGKGREAMSRSGEIMLLAGEAVIRLRLDSEPLGHSGKAASQRSRIKSKDLSIKGQLST